MQFSIATLAVLATAVMAESTLYVTEEVTITSCGPTVTDCPAQSTVVSLTSYPVITSTAAPHVPEYPTEEQETKTLQTTILQTITSCAPEVTDCPYGSVTSTVIPVHPTASAPAPEHPAPEHPAPEHPAPEQPHYPVQNATSVAPHPEAPKPTTLAPASSVVTVTVTECPAETPAVPSKPVEKPEQPHYPVESKPAGETPAYPTGGKPGVPSFPTGTGVPTAPHATGTGAVVPSKTPVFTGAASVNTISALAFAGVIAALFA